MCIESCSAVAVMVAMDQVPIVSIITNVIQLVCKVYLQCTSSKEDTSHYRTYLKKKKFKHYLLPMIPVVGPHLKKGADYDNEGFVLDRVAHCGAHVFQHASRRLKEDRNFIFLASEYDLQVLEHAPQSFIEHPACMLEMINMYKGEALPYISPKLREDAVFMGCVRRSLGVHAVAQAGKSLRSQNTFIHESIKETKDLNVLRYVDVSLLESVEFIESAAAQYGLGALAYATDAFLGDPDCMEDVIAKHGLDALAYAKDTLRESPEFMLRILKYETASHRRDADFMRGRIQQCGIEALHDADILLKEDPEFMWECISVYGKRVMKYLSPSLRGNSVFIDRLAKKFGRQAVGYAAEALRSQPSFIKKYIKKYDLRVLTYSVGLMQDAQFVLDLIAEYGFDVLDYVAEELIQDVEFGCTLVRIYHKKSPQEGLMALRAYRLAQGGGEEENFMCQAIEICGLPALKYAYHLKENHAFLRILIHKYGIKIFQFVSLTPLEKDEALLLNLIETYGEECLRYRELVGNAVFMERFTQQKGEEHVNTQRRVTRL